MCLQGENLSKIAEKVQSLLEVAEKEFDKVSLVYWYLYPVQVTIVSSLFIVEICYHRNCGTNTLLIRR